MHRSVLLLLMSALLLSAAVGLPLSLEESAEKSFLDLLLEDVWDSDELLDSSHENAIHKRAAKDSSGSSEEHKDKAKDKANSSGASSSEEQKTTTDHVAEETTTQAPARRRRQANIEFYEALNVCFDADAKIPGADPTFVEDFKEAMCPDATMWRAILMDGGYSLNSDTTEEPINTGNAIHKRAAKDPSSSSEEHKDKGKDSSGENSSEEQKTTTQATARRRRSASLHETCGWLAEKLAKGEQLYSSDFEMHMETSALCLSWVTDLILKKEETKEKTYIAERFRRQVSGQEQTRAHKASGELELDAQAEKELDEEMARAVADVKDNGSIEDYAQGCEVMEVSSKEANEATYAE